MSTTRIPPPRDAGIEASEAWTTSFADPRSSWYGAPMTPGAGGHAMRERIAHGVVLPTFAPRFGLRRDDVFFCIGSCFAREIEEQLMLRGFDVASIGIRVPAAERQPRPTGVVNKYTTASMLNEVRWALDGEPFPADALVADADGYRDLQLQPLSAAVSYARARERRADVLAYFARLRRATVVVMTLGFVEVWYDHQTRLYLNAAPPATVAQAFPGRFTVHRSDYAENRARLEDVWTLLRRHCAPGVRLVVTTSPTPMTHTFLGDDIVVANGYGKATLRAVSGDLASAHENVEYFGAYEAITASERAVAYWEDQLHVRHDAVRAVVDAFFASFGMVAENPYPEFSERAYLVAHPDVREAVTQGQFATGFAHWLAYGRAEGRDLGDPSYRPARQLRTH